MMKADLENDIDNGTFSWLCKSCSPDIKPNHTEKQPSTSQQPTGVKIDHRATGPAGIVRLSGDPAEEAPNEGASSWPSSSTSKARDQIPPIQPKAPPTQVPLNELIPKTRATVPQQRLYTSTSSTNSTPDTSSWNVYISPIASVGQGPNHNRDVSSRSTTASGDNLVQKDARTSIPRSVGSSEHREDSLIRRMSNLGVTMDDLNPNFPPAESNTEEKDTRLLTVLLREQLEKEDLQPRPLKQRPPHTKCHAKKFRRDSRKGIERVNGFANFYF